MNLKLPIILLFISISIFLSITKTQASHKFCARSCGDDTHVTYPFGFSADCDIQLDCRSNGRVFIGEFPVRTPINIDNFKVNIQPKCNRSIQTLQHLYSNNYAPTSRNAVLLNHCNSIATKCKIPSIEVETQFQSLNCSESDHILSNISCYSNGKRDAGFLDYEDVYNRGCKHLLSSISVESYSSDVSLDVQVVDLGWWIEGSCTCSDDASCNPIVSPHGRLGFQCHCNPGFDGDGYPAGSGCHRKATSSSCDIAKYTSGQCGGKTRIIVLSAVAGASLMLSLGLLYCYIRRCSNSKARNRRKRRLCEATGISIPIYPYKEIEKATSSFSDKQRLGTGAYGTVYAGKLHNSDSWVAIKRIKQRDIDNIDQVMNEIKLISSVSHPNLVRLLGCSIEKGEQILVYEFMANGTLCQHLQRERGHGLAWSVRLNIAIETAQAIAHLHSAINPPIYHRDIKSSNILLDYNFKSKVADFGLSRLGKTEISHISTAPQGTPGYLDPQYHQNFQLSDKSDVYSFGVVLVEIITGLKAVDFSRPQNEVNLANLASDRIGKGHLDEIIDPFLEPHCDAWTISTVHKVAELAFRCLAFHRDMRPSMIEVAAELEQIRTSRWGPSEEIISCTTPSSEVSSSSPLSNVSEKPLSVSFKKMQSMASNNVELMERVKDYSPVSVQDPWSSEQSSSNSLPSNRIK